MARSPASATDISILAYEKQLDRDPRWALSEGSRFFEEKSKVQEALRKITRRLGGLGIDYAIVGGMALFHHGHRRFTEDVDLLVTKEGLKLIHAELEGLGYVPPFKGSKQLRDAELGVKIEFLITGDFPGDGKPKPVAFPDPAKVSFDADGIRYLNLETLIELKLASGMTNPGRIKDLGDVIELIKILNLPRDFAKKLNPYVEEKFDELWSSARRRFALIWPIESLAKSTDELEAMKQDGVIVEIDGASARLVSTDPKIAEKYGMHDESEF